LRGLGITTVRPPPLGVRGGARVQRWSRTRILYCPSLFVDLAGVPCIFHRFWRALPVIVMPSLGLLALQTTCQAVVVFR